MPGVNQQDNAPLTEEQTRKETSVERPPTVRTSTERGLVQENDKKDNYWGTTTQQSDHNGRVAKTPEKTEAEFFAGNEDNDGQSRHGRPARKQTRGGRQHREIMGEDKRQLRHELKRLFSQIPGEDKKGHKNDAEDGQEKQDPTWTANEAECEDLKLFGCDLVEAGAEGVFQLWRVLRQSKLAACLCSFPGGESARARRASARAVAKLYAMMVLVPGSAAPLLYAAAEHLSGGARPHWLVAVVAYPVLGAWAAFTAFVKFAFVVFALNTLAGFEDFDSPGWLLG